MISSAHGKWRGESRRLYKTYCNWRSELWLELNGVVTSAEQGWETCSSTLRCSRLWERLDLESLG